MKWNSGKYRHLFLIFIITLIGLGIFFIISAHLNQSQADCGCDRYVLAASAEKFNNIIHNQSEQEINITFEWGRDTPDLNNLSVYVNGIGQPVSLGIAPGSYVVVNGTTHRDNVIVKAHFNDNYDQKILDMNL
jgi:hypothetical protein